jgi:hypothetical protein
MRRPIPNRASAPAQRLEDEQVERAGNHVGVGASTVAPRGWSQAQDCRLILIVKS